MFYLLWQKEMRELSSGVYNLLKSTRRQCLSVSMLLEQVNTSDEQLEARLSTMLQSVRGTKQFWYLRQSELKCMIREWGSPTLFLTFSCAEYDSPDITEFLMKVNDVPPSYNIGKLCVEDPVSVSRKFSLKFHAFFSQSPFERAGPRYCRPLLLEKGVPEPWGPPLPCPIVDYTCPSH